MNFAGAEFPGRAVSLSLKLRGLISNVWDPSVDNLSALLVTILWCWRGERRVANDKRWICSPITDVRCLSLTSKTPADGWAHDNWRTDKHQPGRVRATRLVAQLYAAEDWRVLLLPDVFPFSSDKRQTSDLCTLGARLSFKSDISLSIGWQRNEIILLSWNVTGFTTFASVLTSKLFLLPLKQTHF